MTFDDLKLKYHALADRYGKKVTNVAFSVFLLLALVVFAKACSAADEPAVVKALRAEFAASGQKNGTRCHTKLLESDGPLHLVLLSCDGKPTQCYFVVEDGAEKKAAGGGIEGALLGCEPKPVEI